MPRKHLPKDNIASTSMNSRSNAGGVYAFVLFTPCPHPVICLLKLKRDTAAPRSLTYRSFSVGLDNFCNCPFQVSIQ
ncbi:hypothetical protein TNCV_407511 [Trichonephila clavipes]|nr:hypothetical protein TNCV_407511 [Trichonephila clavipes]